MESGEQRGGTAALLADRVLEERNAALRVIYDTVLEVEGIGREEMYAVLCRNLRRITGAAAAVFASYEPDGGRLVLRAADGEGLALPTPPEEPPETILAGERVDDWRASPIRRCRQGELAFARFLGEGEGEVRRLACFRETQLLGAAAIRLAPGVRLRMKDLVEAYLNLCAIIIERFNAVAALAESEMRARVFWENARTGIVVVDPARKTIIEANPLAREILRLAGGDGAGCSCRGFLCGGEEPEICPHLRENSPPLNQERALVDRTGNKVWVLATTASVELNGRRLIVESFVDITDRRTLEAQLVQAQKLEAIGQLASGIAHEINTPTQYVSDNIRFLRDAYRGIRKVGDAFTGLVRSARRHPRLAEEVARVDEAAEAANIEFLLEEIPDAVEQAREGVERVAAIVRAMKEFSHPDEKEKQAVDLAAAIESTLTVARNEWKYIADVETDFDPELSEVYCLAGEFNQVILNIVVNAAHAIEDALAGEKGREKGKIVIRTRRDGDEAEIRISDTGSGIPERARAKIFDPFFTTKEVGRGTGQGLAIAYNVVVEKHGGAIDFETESGAGTTFIIRLPIQG